MAVEADILGGDQGIDQVGGQVFVGHIGAVFGKKGAQDLLIGGNHFRCQDGLGLLQILKGGHKSQQSFGNQNEEQDNDGRYRRKGPQK